jgi:hypothetical protein
MKHYFTDGIVWWQMASIVMNRKKLSPDLRHD